MNENKIEGDFCGFAKSHGVIAYKFVSPNRRNVPDRLVICPLGLHFFIEFKKPGEQPRPAQRREIARLRLKGHYVYVISQPGRAERILLKRLSAARARLYDRKRRCCVSLEDVSGKDNNHLIRVGQSFRGESA